MKKRYRKDLTADEIEKILEETKQPFCYHRVVADKFKITVQLVTTLVRESKKQPEKL